MADTPDGAEAGTDVTEGDFDLDSAFEQAFEGWNPEDEATDDTDAEEDVDTDTDEDDTDTEAPDAEEEVEDSDEVEEDTDESDTPELVTVKVNGEEIQVPLKEALAGYSRQADYTAKTQLLAQEREKYAAFEALNDALQQNPQDTLSKLARLYDVQLGEAAQDTPDPLEDLDPALAAEIREMRSMKTEWRAEQEHRAAAERTAQIDSEIQALRVAANDPSLDTIEGQRELLEFAIGNSIESLTLAHEVMTARKAATKGKDATAKVVAKKRKAPPVEGGRNRSKGVTKGIDPSDMTLEQAFDLAVAEHG